jgi:hypothetical protein
MEKTNEYRFLEGGTSWKVPHGRPRRDWKSSIKINFKEMAC